MKILHVINNLDNGGAEKTLTDFLPLLVANGCEVQLLQLSDKRTNKTYIDALRESGVTVTALSHGDTLLNPWFVFEIKKLVTREKFDLVHAHLFPSMYWVAMAAKLFRAKDRPAFVFTEHSTHNRRMDKAIFRVVDRSIYAAYKKIVAISPAVAKMLATAVDEHEDKVVLIKNGIPLQQYANAIPYTRDELSRLFEVPPHGYLLLMTARFAHPKRQDIVIRLMPRLPENVYLLFAGDGEQIDEARALAKTLHVDRRIRFLGYWADMPGLMKSVDQNILCTDYEGLPNAAMESLAAGRPFLISAIPAASFIVPDQRFVFDNDNPEAIAQAIMQVMEDKNLQDSMRKDGVAFVQQFDISKTVASHLDLYRAISRKDAKE